MNLPIKNANNTQLLLSANIVKNVPKIGATSNDSDPTVHLKFFLESWTWFITELDPTTGEAFGMVYSSLCPDGELGYVDMTELSKLRGRFCAVERDIHFKPCKLSVCKNPCG